MQYTEQYPDDVPELHIHVLEDGRQVLGMPPPEDEEPPRDDPREGVQLFANERREAELRAEEEKFRGTAVTVERFNAWRIEYMRKQEMLRAQKEEAYVASLTPKEREEYRRMKAKPTGREIFAKPDARVEEEKTDESVKEVDFSLYSREDRERQAREDHEDDAAQDGYVDDMDE